MSTAKDKKHSKLDSRKPRNTQKQYRDITFHNITLTKADREQFNTFVDFCRDEDIDPTEKLVIEGGYKLSVRYDVESESCLVSITGTDESYNPDICVTSYAETPVEGLYLALYKAMDEKCTEFVIWELEEKTGKRKWG